MPYLAAIAFRQIATTGVVIGNAWTDVLSRIY